MLRDYHDVVIIEVVGHDHYSDLRYHSSNNVLDLPDTDVKFDFHNMLVSPGITPWDEQNPGVAFFEINDSTYIPQNLRMEFLNLDDTIGKSGLTYADLQFNSFDLAKDWGQQNIK